MLQTRATSRHQGHAMFETKRLWNVGSLSEIWIRYSTCMHVGILTYYLKFLAVCIQVCAIAVWTRRSLGCQTSSGLCKWQTWSVYLILITPWFLSSNLYCKTILCIFLGLHYPPTNYTNTPAKLLGVYTTYQKSTIKCLRGDQSCCFLLESNINSSLGNTPRLRAADALVSIFFIRI